MTLKSRWLVIAGLIMAGCGGMDAAQQGNDARSPEAQRGTGTLHTFCSGAPIEVWAGVGSASAGTLVGYLTLSGGTATLTLPNGTTEFPTGMQLQFAASLSGIPVNNSGNPVPGQFEYQFPISSAQSVYTFNFTAPSGTVFAAAHFGFSQPGGVQGFQFLLPTGMVNVSVTMPYAGGPAYFPHTYITNAGSMSGDYLGWCSDPDKDITPGDTYPAMLFSTYDTTALTNLQSLFSPTTFNTDAFPGVNYLLNNFQVGTSVTPVDGSCNPTGEAAGSLTYSDIQKALWYLISDNTSQNQGLFDTVTPGLVNALVCAANANSSFAPACGQKIAFLGVPLAGDPLAVTNQPILATAPVPCGSGEQTAWADGKTGALFPQESQWGTYFKWNTTCTAP